MAVALPFIMIGMTMLGGVMSAQSAQRQAKAKADADRFNAAVAKRNADAARSQGAQDAAAKEREGIKQIGAARAAYGAAGVTSEGSPLDVLASTASNIELDRQTILYKANLRAMGYEDEATLDLMAADNAEKTGDEQATSALLGAGAKAGGQAYSMWG